MALPEGPSAYNSWDNGSGMRVSPVGMYAKTLDEALALAAVSAAVTHNHPEGVKGAQAIAACVFLCKEGKSKQEIKEYVERVFDYDLSRKVADIRKNYSFDVSCQGSVPESIIAFLEGEDFEEVIRLAYRWEEIPTQWLAWLVQSQPICTPFPNGWQRSVTLS